MNLCSITSSMTNKGRDHINEGRDHINEGRDRVNEGRDSSTTNSSRTSRGRQLLRSLSSHLFQQEKDSNISNEAEDFNFSSKFASGMAFNNQIFSTMIARVSIIYKYYIII